MRQRTFEIQTITNDDILLLQAYSKDWNKFAKEILGVRLDRKQRLMLETIHNNKRTTVRSGNSRGKDYVAAVASLCFLFLNYPSKVINTAPTGRQVISIMMSEIRNIHNNSKIPLGGIVLSDKIRFEDDPNWFLEGFKAADKDLESWTGFHSQNLMVVVTEASGIEDITFEAIERILPGGNSKLLLVFNPNRLSGEAYKSVRDPQYSKIKLNCLDAPNVRAKKILIPGQVDWDWVNDHVNKQGWTTQIDKEEVDKTKYDFKWEGQWYRPADPFRIAVLGEFPEEAEGKLIYLSWLETSHDRWKALKGKGEGDLKLGVDVAGMGRDRTVFVYRRGNVVERIAAFVKSDHMATVGKIKNDLTNTNDCAYIDTIGEGAGVYDRCRELNMNVRSAKFSEGAKGRKDKTGVRTFVNMRAYDYWALRDALDPNLEGELALPPDDELDQELTEINWNVQSSGDIIIAPKDKIKERLGKSPDKADAIALTFHHTRIPKVMMI